MPPLYPHASQRWCFAALTLPETALGCASPECPPCQEVYHSCSGAAASTWLWNRSPRPTSTRDQRHLSDTATRSWSGMFYECPEYARHCASPQKAVGVRTKERLPCPSLTPTAPWLCS